MFEFDETTPEALRAQVLAYHMTDVFTDRERARFFGLPEGCRIRERAKVVARDKLSIGSHVFIAGPSVIAPGLTIGDRVIISPLSFVDRDLPGNSIFNPSDDLYRLQDKIRKLEEALEMLLEQEGRSKSPAGGSIDA